MGNPKAFLTINRKEAGYRSVLERIEDFGEVEQTLNTEDRMLQASRCMDCGVPFCHWACPVANCMPEWQDSLYQGKWQEAYDRLSATNNFPEFTGRVCPALCEKSCVLNLQGVPVTIRENEVAIVEHAFQEGYIKPRCPRRRTGKKVAVIGSGPAGLAVADMLNRKGHSVTVIEKDETPGGLLRFGIPDFKLNKKIIDRRISLLEAEGIDFKNNTEVGKDLSVEDLMKGFDAVCLCTGSGKARDLTVEGRDLKGVYFALQLLQQQNRLVRGMDVPEQERISTENKHVLIIGGGDTGSDCVGTAVRQKAASVTQIEILPEPPEGVNPDTPWPLYPNILKTSSSHKEGCTRRWSIASRRFIGEKGTLAGVEVTDIQTGATEVIKADMVFLSMGFVHPVHEGLLDSLGVAYDARGNVATMTESKTSVDKVFVAGDASSGASLVVRAIDSGRKAAASIHKYLNLPTCGKA
ncbi:MAG: glutamate synthase subunit beta [Tannerellaceae bacterium]|jgi:glutamate synthase (NADPH/NADH) small chain|nr:glutamate synthase subunit beta [Tannerellaceae bacterium]